MTRIRAIIALIVCVVGSALGQQTEAKKVVLGKLGQALEDTRIHASANTRARVFYRVKQFEYLVVKASDSQNWLRVLLQNGRYGYVQADAVARLPYDVTANQPAQPALAYRGAANRAAVAKYGTQFQGVPYKWGGNDPLNGIDCSGFVKFLYGQIGLNLPRTAAEQALVGQPITRLEELRAGDRLYFWSSERGKIGHTGVYLGNGYFVHSSSGHGGVATDPLSSPKWLNILVAARR
jgi:cell wall-associated NlpC family hydrolase